MELCNICGKEPITYEMPGGTKICKYCIVRWRERNTDTIIKEVEKHIQVQKWTDEANNFNTGITENLKEI